MHDLRTRSRSLVAAVATALLLPLLALAAPASAQGAPVDTSAFITAAYRSLLGRPPEPGGLAYWQGRIDGGEPPSVVLGAIADSAEHREHVVRQAYLRFLERTPDAEGLRWWADAISDTLTLTGLRAQLLSSPEYAQRSTDGTIEGFVRSAYQEVLGRQPEPGGFQYWVDQLEGGLPRLNMAAFLLRSQEAALQPDLSILGSQPGPYAESPSVDRISVTTDTDVIPAASAVRVTVGGIPVAGDVVAGSDSRSLVFTADQTPTWIQPGRSVPAIVTVYGYDGTTVGRDDYYFFYRRPAFPAQLAAVDGDGRVVVLDSATGAVDRVLLEGIGVSDPASNDIAVTPDRSSVFVTRPGTAGASSQILQVPFAGGPAQVIATGTSPSVSPDGSTLAYIGFQPAPGGGNLPVPVLVLRDLATGSERRLGPGEAQPFTFIADTAWTGDGQHVAFIAGEIQTGLWVVDRDASTLDAASRLGPTARGDGTSWRAVTAWDAGRLAVVETCCDVGQRSRWLVLVVHVDTGTVEGGLLPLERVEASVLDSDAGTDDLLYVSGLGPATGSSYRWGGQGTPQLVRSGIVAAAW